MYLQDWIGVFKNISLIIIQDGEGAIVTQLA